MTDRLPILQPDWALFLDFDGTLVELAPTPDGIHVDPRLDPLLSALKQGLDGAVALVSGRSLEQLDHFLPYPRLAAAGLHGHQLRHADGSEEQPDSDAHALHLAREQLTAFTAAHPGVVLEDKRAALVLHYRQVPEQAEACLAAVEAVVDLATHSLEVLTGKMMAEVKPRGVDKGQAVHHLMQRAPFAGRRPVFIGDDLTDEFGFSAVNELDGLGIRIGETLEGSAAEWRIDDVASLYRWLEASVRLLKESRP